MKILLAVDGSTSSLDAVDCLIRHVSAYRDTPEIELVTVHLPVPRIRGMGAVVSKSQIQRYYTEEGQSNLDAAEKKLVKAGIRFEPRILVGPIAETIVKHAQDAGCDLICIGTRGMSAAANMVLGSIATKVLHASRVPVLLVK